MDAIWNGMGSVHMFDSVLWVRDHRGAWGIGLPAHSPWESETWNIRISSESFIRELGQRSRRKSLRDPRKVRA